MKHLMMALAMGTILSANTCNDDQGRSTLLGRKWVFETVAGDTVKVPEGVERPYLRLADGVVDGSGGCNRLIGTYRLDGQGLSFPGLGSTKMYCESTHATEDAIMSALGKVDGYRVKGQRLDLLGGGSTVATLRTEQDL